jgi:undecaprenyl-diphosphatase
MDALQALILGIVQGLTEWLPVSSTGHLVILENLLGLKSSENLVFDLVLHVGTLLAVVVFFRVELWRIVWSVLAWRSAKTPDQAKLRKLALLLLIGTIPAGIVGVLFKNQIENAFTIRLVGVAMIANAGMLFAAWRFGSKGSRKSAGLVDTIVIGIFQAVSIIPGISRSGSTIGSGMLRGLEKETAAVFAFLLSVPVLAAAFAYGAVALPRYDATLLTETIGLVTSFAVGLISIKYLLVAVKSGKLWIFSLYCVIVGVLVVVLTSI